MGKRYYTNVEHPGIVIGDFNSHNTKWGYRATDADGSKISKWVETEHLVLLFDAKDKGTFHSARWVQDYNPVLCFITTDNKGLSLHSSMKVLNSFPRSQQRPVLIQTGLQISIVRWNFQKAD